MNRNKDVAGKRMSALAEAVMDDVMATPDDQILAEFAEDGIDPAASAARMRSAALAKLRAAKRARLDKARETYQQATKRAAAPSRPPLEEMRRRAMELIRGGAGGTLALAFRNGQELTDADLESLWDDLRELGLFDDGKPND
ncbi:MAG: hypothetical protein IPP84_12800 [Propionivibrio sp.]|uniref:hypothetical protein n=1 Tax=Propionivibrio sp. TaxID=2212460 RepID=UPI0025E0648D|nr:hypothetical protein [Propionivibrio sp.]MBL0208781.1 hypothetical protein [Propionivibrio sp.]